MSVSLSPIFNGYQSFLANGLPNNGGFIYTYAAGTTTPTATYTTNSGGTPNANPIQLSADGRPPQEIWLTNGTAYKFVVTNANLVPIPSASFDNITGLASASDLAASSGASLVGFHSSIGRTVEQQLDMLYFGIGNVTDPKFAGGAKGDGTTDDTAAWLAAIAAAPAAGYHLVLPAGLTSIVSANLVWKSNLWLTLEAGSSIKLKSGSATGIRVVDARGSLSNIGFFGPGKIDGNSAGQTTGNHSHCLAISAVNAIVKNLEVCNAQTTVAGSMGDGVILEPLVGGGAGAFQCQNVLIEGCYIHDNGRQQVTLESGIGIRIIGNRLANTAYSAIDIEINDPTNDAIDGVTIIGNEIIGCDVGVSVVSAAQPARQRNITIMGNNINGGSIGYSLRAISDVCIKGGTVYGSKQGVYLYSDAATTCDNISIDGLIIEGSALMLYGIYGQVVSTGSFTRIDIANVKIGGAATCGISVAAATNITCKNTTTSHATGAGYSFDLCTNLDVIGNKSNNAGSTYAFSVTNSSNVVAAENTVTGGTYGFRFAATSNITWANSNDLRRAGTPITAGTCTNWYGTFSGSFTMGAANQINVNNIYVDAKSIISLMPTNAAAATLHAGATMLWVDPTAASNNVSFRVKTANSAAAAGTETFSYVVHNPII